jgi:hypothetical protein
MLWTLLLYATSTTIAFCAGVAWMLRNREDAEAQQFGQALNHITSFPFRWLKSAARGTAPSKSPDDAAGHTPPTPALSSCTKDAA